MPGPIPAALLYSLYPVGYGMTGREMLFLFGLEPVFGAGEILPGGRHAHPHTPDLHHRHADGGES